LKKGTQDQLPVRLGSTEIKSRICDDPSLYWVMSELCHFTPANPTKAKSTNLSDGKRELSTLSHPLFD
jgi:hypothetical protein